ncbi:MAG TPA: DUF1571 domain-containing protein [Isosphaeraceae bacterium]|nr:DUF1571 domain-containing protein [Isosphaeraceae bacterium]
MGENRTGLSGAFWNRSDQATKAAAYDPYADAAAAARPQAGDDAQLASGDAKARRKSATTEEPAPDLVAQEDATRSPDAAARRKRAKTGDTSIRVTLGRPESLPTLKDPGDAGRPMLASAATTNWKRGNSAVESETAPEPGKSRSRESAGQNATDDLAEQRRTPTRDVKLQKVLAAAKDRLDALSTYQVNITRVERVGGQMHAEEEVVLNIRRNPKAVRLEWAKGPNKGREVIYSAAINDRMMYVNSGNSALPFPRMTIPVDSPLALRNSRHPITEAGFDMILDNLFKFLEPKTATVASDGKLIYKGIDRPRGLDQPCHLVERVTPKGETWQVYLDTQTLMPAMVSCVQTSSGELIERYTYRNLKPNPAELASIDAFDPDKRWGESKGWLSRIARAAGTPTDASSRQLTTR